MLKCHNHVDLSKVAVPSYTQFDSYYWCVLNANISCYGSVLLVLWLFYWARGLSALWFSVSC